MKINGSASITLLIVILSCGCMTFSKGNAGSESADNHNSVLVIATSGHGASAKSVSGVCRFFENRGFDCVGVDSASSNRDEQEVASDISVKIERYRQDYEVIVLWGGSNGALTSMMAAEGRNDVYTVAATSPPVFIDYDREKYGFFENLDTNLIYVFGERDFTDEQTAKSLVEEVRRNGKAGRYSIIPDAGHEICCGDKRALRIQYEFIEELTP